MSAWEASDQSKKHGICNPAVRLDHLQSYSATRCEGWVYAMTRAKVVLLRGKKAILVPYRPEHVVEYHYWMQHAIFPDSTVSDPLTLQEEYEMQQNWALSKDKVVFVILSPQLRETTASRGRGGGLVGSVSLFLKDSKNKETAEIEVMTFTEFQGWGQDVAAEALIMCMLYAISELGLNKFVAKFEVRDDLSRQLFDNLGFGEQSRNAVFKEVTSTLEITKTARIQLLELLPYVMSIGEIYDTISAGSCC